MLALRKVLYRVSVDPDQRGDTRSILMGSIQYRDWSLLFRYAPQPFTSHEKVQVIDNQTTRTNRFEITCQYFLT